MLVKGAGDEGQELVVTPAQSDDARKLIHPFPYELWRLCRGSVNVELPVGTGVFGRSVFAFNPALRFDLIPYGLD